MDRPIALNVRRRTAALRWLALAAVVASGAGLFLWGTEYLRPSVERARVRIAAVDVGPLEATITATGVIEPEFEQVISSPIATRVLRILKRPGDAVRAGDPILELDVDESRLAVERVGQQLALKQNQIAATRLALEKTLTGLKGQVDIKVLEVDSLEAKSAQQRQLAARGVVSDNAVRQAELDERTARIQLDQLRKTMETEKLSAQTTADGLALELDTLRGDHAEAAKRLELATTRADRDGVLTWVVQDEGSTVQTGDVVARIADLDRFRVKATVSDIHSDRLATGLPAKVKINDEWFVGYVKAVLPTVENGTMAAEIALDDASNSLLKSNLRVDVYLVTERRDRALRLAKGPFATASGTQQVYVVRGNRAVRVPVRLGIADFDRYEVADGLAEGDEVIVSDTSDFAHAGEIRLR
jgi:HlyD family secretion protein